MEATMHNYWIGAAVAAALLVYLAWALLKAEDL
jgi:K+-transporting ATPase KdpF subunit